MFARLYWILPAIGALAWLGTILGLLIHWVTIGEPHYSSMEKGQTIAYISDVGAQELKPLFIAGSAVTVVTLDIALIAERWLRHLGRLAPNTSWAQKILSIISIIAGIAGAAGLIFLSIFDTAQYPRIHDDLLVLFIVGYLISAIFICAEYQRLGIHFRKHPVLRASFWVKLAFIIIEIALAIPFGIYETSGNHSNTAAILEWAIAFVFVFYVFTFVMDLAPAIQTHEPGDHPAAKELEMQKREENGYTNGNGYGNGTAASNF